MKTISLTNIGKSMEARLAREGITTVEEFLAHDPEELYFKLEKHEPKLHLAVLACFVGAHSGTPWYLIYKDVKGDFLRRHPNFYK